VSEIGSVSVSVSVSVSHLQRNRVQEEQWRTERIKGTWRFKTIFGSLNGAKGNPVTMTSRPLSSLKSIPSLTLPLHTANNRHFPWRFMARSKLQRPERYGRGTEVRGVCE
jgi:hypothetical protein